jgi:hypothetical protein
VTAGVATFLDDPRAAPFYAPGHELAFATVSAVTQAMASGASGNEK